MAEEKITNYTSDTNQVVEVNNPAPRFDYTNKEVILKVKHLKQYFRFGKGEFKYTKAVHDVSFDVYKGEVFGLVGESGCGKTTTGRSIIKLYKITSGDVWFKGVRIAAGTRWNEKEIKYTKIRLKQFIKASKAQEADEVSDVIQSDDDYKEKVAEIRARYQAERQEKINAANVIIEEQRAKIIKAKHDDKYCNQDMVQSELARVNESFKEFQAKNNILFGSFICDKFDEKVPLLVKILIVLFGGGSVVYRFLSFLGTKINKYIKSNVKDLVWSIVIALNPLLLLIFIFLDLFSLIFANKFFRVGNPYVVIDSDEGNLTESEKLARDFYKELNDANQASITRKMQMIFQDPIASLNPRMTVRNIIAEGLIIKGVKDQKFINKEVNRVLELVGLLPEHANRYPHEFSGGQRQRIGIARAIIMNPELIIADEPVSALDVSIQAQVINLLNDLRNNLGLTILFIAHNLSVVKYFCDRIAVMYYGKLMEVATSEELFAHPCHPYTVSLLSAVPHPDPNVERGRTRIAYNPAKDHDYSTQQPTLREIVPGHFVRCNDEEEARYVAKILGK